MRNFTKAEINSYVKSGDPLDKAGAYAIQHAKFNPVSRITGCYANVVGLPLCHLTRMLRSIGYLPKKDVTSLCLTPAGYDCQLAEIILKNS
jgi:predicted house-cleaning NTP pyrophosphatase (Maf/HAM1 superfamily)